MSLISLAQLYLDRCLRAQEALFYVALPLLLWPHRASRNADLGQEGRLVNLIARAPLHVMEERCMGPLRCAGHDTDVSITRRPQTLLTFDEQITASDSQRIQEAQHKEG